MLSKAKCILSAFFKEETNDDQEASCSSDLSEEYICINCGEKAETLYQQYSDDGIRLTECNKCAKIVDKYIEYDTVLIIIDLILQYIGAYRHLFMNTKFRSYHKLCTIFLLCDAYTKWIRQRLISGTENVYDLEWKFYGCLLQSALEMISFVGLIIVISRPKDFWLTLRATCAGFYGSVFVVLSTIWDLHLDSVHGALCELFIFISHVQVQRTIFKANSFSRNLISVTCAAVLSRLVGMIFYKYYPI